MFNIRHTFLAIFIFAFFAGSADAASTHQTLSAIRTNSGSPYCPSQPFGSARKYTCYFGPMSFSHDSSGVKDAYMNSEIVQFVVDNSSNPTVGALVQGDAAGVDWNLQVSHFSLSYTDSAGVSHVIAEKLVPTPSEFFCRKDAKHFSSDDQKDNLYTKRNLLMDALGIEGGKTITLTVYSGLVAGGPGSGC